MTELLDDDGRFKRVPSRQELLKFAADFEEALGDGIGSKGHGFEKTSISLPKQQLVLIDGFRLRCMAAAQNGQTLIPVGYHDRGIPRWWPGHRGIVTMLKK